jgi:hypothetical protein
MKKGKYVCCKRIKYGRFAKIGGFFVRVINDLPEFIQILVSGTWLFLDVRRNPVFSKSRAWLCKSALREPYGFF